MQRDYYVMQQILFCQLHGKLMLMTESCAFFDCSLQQNDHIPCYQPLPLHGFDIYHLSAKGGLWLQGQHCPSGETLRDSTVFTCFSMLFYLVVCVRSLLLCGFDGELPLAVFHS